MHNQYGTTSSHLHGGLPTDRLIAEWWLQAPRAVAAGEETERPADHARIEARISVPANIAEIRLNDPATARKVQAEIGEQFSKYLGEGLAVTDFEKNDTEGAYLLSLWPSK